VGFIQNDHLATPELGLVVQLEHDFDNEQADEGLMKLRDARS
jgi:hypothetical protein